MKAAIKFFIYMALIMVVMYSSGCAGQANNIQDDNEKQVQGQELQDPSGDNLATADSDHMPATDSQGTGSSATPASTTGNHAAPAALTQEANTTIVLYFANNNGYLQAEQRTVKKIPGIARQAIYELCRGPQSQSLAATIPDGTRLLDINIKDGLCIVNFSRELVAKHSGGSGAENATVYSIVNTLTQFSSINRVQILVEGQVVDSIAGHLDVSVPITRDDEIIRAGTPVQ
ncbi:GerMN domain-containing protein [Desulfallas thermosapovorans]|uniref:Sporulation and spore germination protein n=1 Tax=Desulfallas thermosapovorans DSM 6562 TaxID=1121431 RepID=A0A5S4ZT56_9FIRM|nr:GerMN domain-containing protein [Desulfallas thermosapovorans]TYO96142.1 sporulation and spore germination protein [Desulfallas thermosapovorans DSM 6562]